MMCSFRLFRVLVAVVVVIAVAPAQDWAHWRGPNYNGAVEAEGLPSDFSKTRGVKWSKGLPGSGASTPIVVGDRIFLTCADSVIERLLAVCLDRKTGKILWKRAADSGFGGAEGMARLGSGRRSNYASPSPATDGERVFFFFGNGDLVGYDLDGTELWRRNVQKDYGRFAFQWTFSASPTYSEGRIFLPVLQRDTPVGRGRRRGDDGATAPIDSFILAIDPKTGKDIYKVSRPSPARVESRECYATMIPFVGTGGRKEILCVGGDVLTGHDPATGKELWRWGTWNEGHRQRAWRLVPTVVPGSDVALVCAPKRAPVFAIRLNGTGELGADALAWKSEGRRNPITSDVPTPAYAAGHFYVLSDMQYAVSKVNAKTGEVVWSRELSRDFLWRASPTVADGKVFCMNHNGHVTVVDVDSGKILHEVDMGEEDDDQIRASIVVAQGQIFIRTYWKLFCIGA